MKLPNIEYFSGEVREILGTPPPRAVRWAFAITTGVFVLMTFAAFTFSFPETISGQLVLTTAEPPINVVAPKTGMLAQVKVKEGDIVAKNTLIAVFENGADVNDVLELENDLNQLNSLDIDAIRAFTPNRLLDLDRQLDVLYQDFINSLEFVPLYEGDQIDQKAINAVIAENVQLERYTRGLLDAIASANKDIKTKKNLIKNISEEYADQPGKTEYSTKILALDEEIKKLESQIAKYESEIEKNKERIKSNNSKIWQLRVDRQSGTQERIFRLSQNISALRKAIAKWKEENLVFAPADGKVSFFNNLELKKRYTKGEELAAIIPITKNLEYIGLVTIPVEGSGKVKKGQQVRLKFHRYPFLEFGQVKATVTKIYPLSKGNAYSVETALPNGLVTNHGKTLEYYQQMEGTAEIITDQRLFIQRLFDNFINFWK
ncbi:MAG TPA: HlyD family efflux transporter periplasmic adaptor subunit [Bacteroidetes bacterium]|nr:HlyD family efflux transporter periplasmic adaptor subunit [Bacteroidota bacterium]